MRIVLDLQGAQSDSRVRGIGRYSLSLARAIARDARGHEIVVALNGRLLETIEPIRAAFDGLLPQSQIRVWQAPGPVAEVISGTTPTREAAEQIREAFLASLRPDVVHVSSLFEGFGDDAVTSIGALTDLPTAVTLYDLIPLSVPHPNPAYRAHYERKLQALHRADRLFGISQYSADEAVRVLAIPAERVVTISCAADAQFRRRDVAPVVRTAILTGYGITKPFVCSIGAPEARKNVDALFRAFAELPGTLRATHQIVLVGDVSENNREELVARAKACGLHPAEIVITGHVSDDDLVLFYNTCRVFAFPSLHEGFGLPALEAMQSGAAVIASNATSLPEVVGLDEALFDPRSTPEFARLLSRVLSDEDFHERLVTHGLAQARRFSWAATAARALDALEAFHRSSARRSDPVPRRTLMDAVAGSLLQTPSGRATAAAAAAAIACNDPSPRAASLFVDVSELIQRDVATGVQRVTRSILAGLLKTPPSGFVVHPVFSSPRRHGYVHARRFAFEKFGVETGGEIDRPIDFQPGDIFFGLDLQHQVVIAQERYFRELRACNVAVYFLIYDLLPVLLPHYFDAGTSERHEQWLSAVSTADGAICISRDVADRYVAWLDTSLVERHRPLRIAWCHLGSDIENSIPTRGLPGDSMTVLNRIAARPGFLIVGTIEPRKGYLQTLLAFEQLWSRGVDVNLVIVGRRGWMVDAIVERLAAHPRNGTHLFWLQDVSDEYLERLYAACSCLLAPSEGEGYGLPLVEAARHGKPVLARDLPVFREVAGGQARYFSGLGPEDIADAVTGWLESPRHDRPGITPAFPTWNECLARLKVILTGGETYATWSPGQVRGAGDPGVPRTERPDIAG